MYNEYFDCKSAPKHTLKNRQKISEFLNFDYNKFCNYISIKKLSKTHLYDVALFYILDCRDDIIGRQKVIKRQFEAFILEIRKNMYPLFFQLTENFSAYELCNYLDVDYKKLIEIDFSQISPIDAIQKLKLCGNTFISISNHERLTESLSDIIYLNQVNFISFKEPIKETTYEWYLEYKIEQLEIERQIIKHYGN